jgi:putative phosphoribosyl transferase
MQISACVKIPIARFYIEGDLFIGPDARGIIAFSHGSGSSRFSPRNNYVARLLNERGLGTLLIDLLTLEEDATYEVRFNIDLLTSRVRRVVNWLSEDSRTSHLPIGLFGASTGAASVLRCAAVEHDAIKAIVSRGGRPDLAQDALEHVVAPTLLLVGGNDRTVLGLNQRAYEALTCEKKLVVVPGATHLFEEPGALEQVADHAARWFSDHLSLHAEARRASMGNAR